jgi:hypothetical protein
VISSGDIALRIIVVDLAQSLDDVVQLDQTISGLGKGSDTVPVGTLSSIRPVRGLEDLG